MTGELRKRSTDQMRRKKCGMPENVENNEVRVEEEEDLACDETLQLSFFYLAGRKFYL